MALLRGSIIVCEILDTVKPENRDSENLEMFQLHAKQTGARPGKRECSRRAAYPGRTASSPKGARAC